MKSLTLILLTAILSVHLPAQNLTDKFGKVSEWEAAMTSYDKDPEAEALYIYDKRDLAFMNDFRYDYNVYVRIKIFSKNALDLADVEIPLHVGQFSGKRVRSGGEHL